MATQGKIDWSACPLVEIKPGVQSGAPMLCGTRMPVNAIVDNFDHGVSIAEIAERFEIGDHGLVSQFALGIVSR
jgi:uncharacterized protein (DUF433 family)